MLALNSSDSIRDKAKIGVVFTPLDSCKQVLVDFGLFEKWLEGKVFFDPTAGEGNFLEAFIELAFDKNIPVTDRMLERLYANEIEQEYIQNFFEKIRNKFGIVFPKNNFFNKDIILDDLKLKVDILVGNPPWANFNDLPEEYKDRIKPSFIKYDLVKNTKDLLLGGSRIDIATLVASKTIKDHLSEKGEAYYFLPLSIFLNGDAHRSFRSYSINSVDFCVKKIIDFKDADIFGGLVSTRYGFAVFQRDLKQHFPIEYHLTDTGVNIIAEAKPLYSDDDALTIIRPADHESFLGSHFKITINENQKPRQGINTCGKNDLYIFDSYEPLDSELVRVKNKMREVTLPRQFICPLLTRSVLTGTETNPEKWVLLPYDKVTGKLLNEKQMELYPTLLDYLNTNRESLISRKGVLIQAGMKNGAWWGLLGVGQYSFAPYKIFWQAYGDKKFTVRLLDGTWQANQSMHAFIPVWDLRQAEDLISKFQDPFIEKYLLSHRMEGTCNWAQPGKVSKLLNLQVKQSSLFEPALA